MILSFYSYKGGVGRTTMLANVAVILGLNGYRVLVVDLDLEAPTLPRVFGEAWLGENVERQERGAVNLLFELQEILLRAYDSDGFRFQTPQPDLIAGCRADARAALHEALAKDVVRVHPPDHAAELPWDVRLLPAGPADLADYTRLWSQLRWDVLAPSKSVRDQQARATWAWQAALSPLRQAFLYSVDVVLIDSRTGLNATAGLSSALLSDGLVVFGGLQGLDTEGLSLAIQRAVNSRAESVKLPVLGVTAPTRVTDDFDWVFRGARELRKRARLGRMPVVVPYDVGRAKRSAPVSNELWTQARQERRSLAAKDGEAPRATLRSIGLDWVCGRAAPVSCADGLEPFLQSPTEEATLEVASWVDQRLVEQRELPGMWTLAALSQQLTRALGPPEILDGVGEVIRVLRKLRNFVRERLPSLPAPVRPLLDLPVLLNCLSVPVCTFSGTAVAEPEDRGEILGLWNVAGELLVDLVAALCCAGHPPDARGVLGALTGRAYLRGTALFSARSALPDEAVRVGWAGWSEPDAGQQACQAAFEALGFALVPRWYDPLVFRQQESGEGAIAGVLASTGDVLSRVDNDPILRGPADDWLSAWGGLSGCRRGIDVRLEEAGQ